MANIGRNDPCPCGSGKKHKKCCLASTQPVPAATPSPPRIPAGHDRDHEVGGYGIVEDDLDELSNSVVDLIQQHRLDEALAACARLQREWPDVIDYLERFAMVHEARGDWALATDYYRRALAFTEQPDQRDGFDEEGRADYRRKIAQNQARSAAP